MSVYSPLHDPPPPQNRNVPSIWTNLAARSSGLWQLNGQGCGRSDGTVLAGALQQPRNGTCGSGGTPPRSWLCQLNGTVHIHMGQFESVDCNGLRLALDVDLKSFVARLNDPEGTFIRALQWGVVGIPTDEHKLGLLKTGRDRGRRSSVSRSRNRG